MKLLLLLWLTISLSAYDGQRAMTNLSHEYAECAVFYFISYEAATKSKRYELANQLKSAANYAIIAATTLSNVDVTRARMQMAMKEQDKLIKNDYSNMSILILKYLESCNEAIDNPENRMNYWLEKKD